MNTKPRQRAKTDVRYATNVKPAKEVHEPKKKRDRHRPATSIVQRWFSRGLTINLKPA